MGDTYARDQSRGQPPTSVPAAVTAFVVAVTILVIAGCSSLGPTTTATTPTAAPGSVDPAPTAVPPDIQQVCTRFVVAALSVDTTTDRGPADARVRAARAYGVPELAALLQGHGKDPDWPVLVAHRARVHVSTQPVGDDPPPVRGDEAAAGVHATRVAVGADNWRRQLSDTVAYCTLRRGPDGWKVTDLSFSDSSSTSGAGR
jgi:hypothetical protein